MEQASGRRESAIRIQSLVEMIDYGRFRLGLRDVDHFYAGYGSSLSLRAESEYHKSVASENSQRKIENVFKFIHREAKMINTLPRQPINISHNTRILLFMITAHTHNAAESRIYRISLNLF